MCHERGHTMTGTVTFLEQYRRCIRPRLEAIDIFLRTAKAPYAPGEAAALLSLPCAEAADKAGFLHLLFTGESALCRLVQREAERGAPVLYTPADIAYIYNIQYEAVGRACDDLHMREATALLLPDIFARIPAMAYIHIVYHK